MLRFHSTSAQILMPNHLSPIWHRPFMQQIIGISFKERMHQRYVAHVWYIYLLTLSWLKSLSYRNQSIDLLCKSVDWFLFDRDLPHEIVGTNKSQKSLPSRHLLNQSQQWKHQNNVQKLFKVNFEQTLHIVLVFPLLTLNK